MPNENLTPALVSLVGAGPGDPELITVKGLRRLQQADVVIYDALVSPALLEHVRPDAQLIYAGKRPGKRRVHQETINTLLVEQARVGNRVVRLKGGDPFVFGRGGEEAEMLHAAGIPFEVVPGVSSAIAVPASVGIPVTQRDRAANFTVITGCRKKNLTIEDCQDWEALARLDTLVILMGMRRLPQIAAQLIAAGRTPSTPAAVIQWGTTPRQKVATGSLADIAEQAHELTSPGTIVVGEVVKCQAEDSLWHPVR